jgi:hypothetical protein
MVKVQWFRLAAPLAFSQRGLKGQKSRFAFFEWSPRLTDVVFCSLWAQGTPKLGTPA